MQGCRFGERVAMGFKIVPDLGAGHFNLAADFLIE